MKIADRIRRSLIRSKATVVFTSDFLKFGSRSAVAVALNMLVKEKILIRVGKGLYSKTRQIKPYDLFVPRKSVLGMGMEVLSRLGVQFRLGQAERAHLEGGSTQLPVRSVLDVMGRRITREISYKGHRLSYENNK